MNSLNKYVAKRALSEKLASSVKSLRSRDQRVGPKPKSDLLRVINRLTAGRVTVLPGLGKAHDRNRNRSSSGARIQWRF